MDIKNYWNTWLWRDALTRIITINVIMWIVIKAGLVILSLTSSDLPGFAGLGRAMNWMTFFAMSNDPYFLIQRPWTVLSYMFSSFDFLNLLMNMLWLMLFGRICMLIADGRRLTVVYIVGGLAGAAAFFLCYFFKGHEFLVGASCSVLAVATAVAIMKPGWKVNLLLLGEVKIIWIYLVCILFFVVLSPEIEQAAAHIGGMAGGALMVFLPRYVRLPWFGSRYTRHKSRNSGTGDIKDYDKPSGTGLSDSESREMDTLLDKVNRSGYSSLTPSERQRLFNLSQKIKK